MPISVGAPAMSIVATNAKPREDFAVLQVGHNPWLIFVTLP